MRCFPSCGFVLFSLSFLPWMYLHVVANKTQNSAACDFWYNEVSECLFTLFPVRVYSFVHSAKFFPLLFALNLFFCESTLDSQEIKIVCPSNWCASQQRRCGAKTVANDNGWEKPGGTTWITQIAISCGLSWANGRNKGRKKMEERETLP